MSNIPQLPTLLEQINQQTLRATLNDVWCAFAFKIFIRLSEPFIGHTPLILKQIRIYELSNQILNDQNEYLRHVDDLISTCHDELWKSVFSDLRHHSDTYNEFRLVARRLQNELIRDIHRSREWNEFQEQIRNMRH